MSATEKAQAFLLLAAVAVLAFGACVHNGFVWDDHLVIVRNDFVKDPAHIPRLFSRSYLTDPADFSELGRRDIGSGEVTWRPLTTLSYFALFGLFGLEPGAYHAANLLLHMLNAWLLLLFCMRLGMGRAGALFAAVLFAGHAAAAESVHCISYNENLLCLAFLLGGLLVHARGSRPILAAALFFLSMLSKETGLIFLPLVFLYDRHFRPSADLSKDWRFFGAAGAVYAILRFLVFRMPENWMFAQGATIWTLFKTTALSWSWMFFPWLVRLTLPQDPSIMASSPDPAMLVSVGLVGLLLFMAVRWRRTRPLESFAVFFFFLGLVPTIPLLMSNISGRYLYVSLAGFCLLAGSAFQRAADAMTARWGKAAWTLILIPTLLVLPSFDTARIWRDDVSFFQEIVEKNPDIALGHSELARRLRRQGRLEEAVVHYRRALELDPDWAEDRFALGDTYLQAGRLDEAEVELKKALELRPGWSQAASSLDIIEGLRSGRLKARFKISSNLLNGEKVLTHV